MFLGFLLLKLMAARFEKGAAQGFKRTNSAHIFTSLSWYDSI